MSESSTTETAKVTLPGGVIVELPKAEAEKIIVAQQKINEEKEALGRKVGAVEAERKAAEAKALQEATEKEALKLANAGELDKAKALWQRDSENKLLALTDRVKDQELTAAIRKAGPYLDDSAVSDMKAIIAQRAAFHAESGKVIILDEAGKPMQKDGQPVDAHAYLPDWLATRKHFQSGKVPASNGGSGGSQQVATGEITVKDLGTASKEMIAGLISGKVKLVE